MLCPHMQPRAWPLVFAAVACCQVPEASLKQALQVSRQLVAGSSQNCPCAALTYLLHMQGQVSSLEPELNLLLSALVSSRVRQHVCFLGPVSSSLFLVHGRQAEHCATAQQGCGVLQHMGVKCP